MFILYSIESCLASSNYYFHYCQNHDLHDYSSTSQQISFNPFDQSDSFHHLDHDHHHHHQAISSNGWYSLAPASNNDNKFTLSTHIENSRGNSTGSNVLFKPSPLSASKQSSCKSLDLQLGLGFQSKIPSNTPSGV